MRAAITLVSGLLTVCGLFACGSEKDADDTSTESTTYTFTTDIDPIIKASCGGNTTCHAQGETGTNFEGNKSVFVAAAEDIITRVDSSDAALVMPKPGYGVTLSDDHKKVLKAYLSQRVKD